jgi:hypothetical protein
MNKQPLMGIDEFISATKYAISKLTKLQRLNTLLVILCWVGLFAGLAVKLLGGSSAVVISIWSLSGMLGIASIIPNRLAKPIESKLEIIRHVFNESNNTNTGQPVERANTRKIPLTIGFANLSGEDINAAVTEDVTELSPLFSRSMRVPAHQIPAAEILFIYAHLNNDGTIVGLPSSSIRQIIQATNSAIVVLATPNSPESINNAISLPGPKSANIVFTISRNGGGFSRFFRELFEKMCDGKEMLSAWVELAPQSPSGNSTYAPQTILLSEGGKIAFPQ